MVSIMDGSLLLAPLVVAVIAAVHSARGERRLLQPLLDRGRHPGSDARQDAEERTQGQGHPLEAGLLGDGPLPGLMLRLAWHLTSLLLLGCALLLLVLAFMPADGSALLVLGILGGTFVAAAAVTGSSSGGRHPAWPLFTLAGGLCWGSLVADGAVAGADRATALLGAGISLVLMALAALHLGWAVAGPAGFKLVVPEREGRPVFRPGRRGTLAVALALAAASLLVAQRRFGLFGPGAEFGVAAGCWALAAVLLARAVGDFRYVGLFKTVRTMAFGLLDTAAYTPACLLLGLAVVALNIA